MVDANSLIYLLYSLFTLVGRDEPTSDPSLNGWEVDSKPEAWNQLPFDHQVKHNEESCPPGEVFSNCYAGSQETCENVGRSMIFPITCVPGCVCEQPGTVRGYDGTCIPPTMCSSNVEQQLSQNSELSSFLAQEDKAELPETRNSDLPWFWRKDNRELEATQNADLLSLKSQEDGEQKVTGNADVPPFWGQDNTETQFTEHAERHPLSWDQDDKGDSDEIDQTEQTPQISGDECPKSEILSCKKFCERNCDNLDQKEIPCPKFCIQGCICKPGYVRGPAGKCIEPKKCPKNARVSHHGPQPGILGGNHGCPNNEECAKYCREHRGKEVGTCQGYEHMECLCPR